MENLDKFIQDIKEYIANHPYLKEQETELVDQGIPSNKDFHHWEAHTVNGDYERIIITVDLIP